MTFKTGSTSIRDGSGTSRPSTPAGSTRSSACSGSSRDVRLHDLAQPEDTPHAHAHDPRSTPDPHAHAPDGEAPGAFPHDELDAYRIACELAALANNTAAQIPRGPRNIADQLLRGVASRVSAKLTGLMERLS